MFPLAVVLAVLAAPPPAVTAWAQAACPLPPREAASNAEFKVQQAERVACLERAMNRELDKVLRPLQKKDAAALAEWMGLQSDFHRWAREACATVEDARWIHLRTGARSMGTSYGSAERECLQAQYAWRGFFAGGWSRGEWKVLFAVLEASARQGPRRQEALSQYTQRAEAAARRAPAKAAQQDTPSRSLSPEEWARHLDRLSRLAHGPQALAGRQCALMPKPPPSCAPLLVSGFMDPLDFQGVLDTSSDTR
ncbi:hypothetical protein [Stigmatella erecta]|uniref:Lysozyme inhibitor LprI N-terminal domain-containing protein n=1 Tax=Stigmatella erecta TaxID=83460 RepID=A0A1I0KGH5_9BACT|nr:hypothetical protein [Stigmatella erecta]SEU22723.1 hypothetical protein SAMN05443639_110163 [Stigmatella erecta]